MFANDVKVQEILSWINEEGHFKEMTLTPEGTLFVDPAKLAQVDEWWLYHKSVIYLPASLYVSTKKGINAFGETLKSSVSFSLMKNKTEIGLHPGGTCCISSRNAGIPKGSSLLVFFRYRGKVVLIIAGDIVNHRSQIIIMEATTENDTMAVNAFNEYLEIVNHNLAAKLTDSQFALKPKNQQLVNERNSNR